jgi:hypothetical protein
MRHSLLVRAGNWVAAGALLALCVTVAERLLG